jgi:hypothetical protein
MSWRSSTTPKRHGGLGRRCHPAQFQPKLEQGTLLKRLPTLAEVADTAAFIASDRAGAMTATVGMGASSVPGFSPRGAGRNTVGSGPRRAAYRLMFAPTYEAGSAVNSSVVDGFDGFQPAPSCPRHNLADAFLETLAAVAATPLRCPGRSGWCPSLGARRRRYGCLPPVADDLGGVAAGVVGCPGPLIGTCLLAEGARS